MIDNPKELPGKLVFNFCRPVVNSACGKSLAGMIMGDKSCTPLSGSSLGEDVEARRDYERTGDDEEGGL